MEIFNSPEFWMAMSALTGLVALFIPAPYRPIALLAQKIITMFIKNKMPGTVPPTPQPPVPDLLPEIITNPMDTMREAEARFRERQNE